MSAAAGMMMMRRKFVGVESQPSRDVINYELVESEHVDLTWWVASASISIFLSVIQQDEDR